MNNRMLSSTSIVGTDVKNATGESLGSVKDLMINTNNGEIEYAVLSFGGFLGMGDKFFAIPWSSFTIDREDEDFILNVNKELLEKAPGFDKDNWPTTAGSEYLNSVKRYYTPTPVS